MKSTSCSESRFLHTSSFDVDVFDTQDSFRYGDGCKKQPTHVFPFCTNEFGSTLPSSKRFQIFASN